MKNANQPAKPISTVIQYEEYNGIKTAEAKEYYLGLTKREHFAAMAMQGLACSDGTPYSLKEMAKESVEWADALLAELDK